MDFNKDRYKTANKNVNRLTFVFERQLQDIDVLSQTLTKHSPESILLQ